jgi:hypothetical protein
MSTGSWATREARDLQHDLGLSFGLARELVGVKIQARKLAPSVWKPWAELAEIERIGQWFAQKCSRGHRPDYLIAQILATDFHAELLSLQCRMRPMGPVLDLVARGSVDGVDLAAPRQAWSNLCPRLEAILALRSSGTAHLARVCSQVDRGAPSDFANVRHHTHRLLTRLTAVIPAAERMVDVLLDTILALDSGDSFERAVCEDLWWDIQRTVDGMWWCSRRLEDYLDDVEGRPHRPSPGRIFYRLPTAEERADEPEQSWRPSSLRPR